MVTGVDRAGKVQAQKMHYLWNCGGYGGYGVNIVRSAGYTRGGAYEFPLAAFPVSLWLEMRSGSPVPVEVTGWGSVKALFRR